MTSADNDLSYTEKMSLKIKIEHYGEEGKHDHLKSDFFLQQIANNHNHNHKLKVINSKNQLLKK
jgi:hypothetical protein